jgi:transposase
MCTCPYASDLCNEKWIVLRPLLPRSNPTGRRQTYPLRRIIDAFLYTGRTGAQWRMLPHENPPFYAVLSHYALWREDGLWEQVTRVLRRAIAAISAGILSPPRRSSIASRSGLLRWALRAARHAVPSGE